MVDRNSILFGAPELGRKTSLALALALPVILSAGNAQATTHPLDIHLELGSVLALAAFALAAVLLIAFRFRDKTRLLSDAKQSELDASEGRFQDFASASSDWFWEMDQDLRFSYFSDNFTAITGVPQETLLGKTREETGIPDVNHKDWLQHLADLAAHRSFRDFRHPRTFPDGRRVFLSINGKPVFDAAGTFRGYRGTGADVTQQQEAEVALIEARTGLERRVEARTAELSQTNDALTMEIRERQRVEQALREREALYRQAHKLARLGSWTLDIERDLLFISPEMAEIMRVPHREVAELPYRDFIERFVHPDDQSRIRNLDDTETYRGEQFEIEYRLLAGDGEIRWVHEYGEAVYGTSGAHKSEAGTVQDITDQKLSEEQQRQSQKMRAVGQLTGGVSHDFNNLLAVIMGNAELLEDTLGKEEPVVSAIMKAATRGAELTQQLLAFSRKQPLNPQTINMDDLVGGMSGLLSRTLGETIDIAVRQTAGLWPAITDPGQMENALLNLVINARDAMPDGGKLTLETANVHLDQAYAVSHPDAQPGDFVMLAVSDNGVGMTAEILEQVFEPFFTTKEVGSGSGLGLSMVYGFAKQTGGHATIYSEEGHGTTVKIYLPRAEPVAGKPAAAPAGEAPRARGEKVLVLEDDPSVRELAVAMLKALGYDVLQAGTGRAALEVLQVNQGIHLLLSDVVLPGGMSGPALAEQAKDHQPDLKVLFMSGYAEKAIYHNQSLVNGAELLNKPFRKRELALRVREVLDEPQIAAK